MVNPKNNFILKDLPLQIHQKSYQGSDLINNFCLLKKKKTNFKYNRIYYKQFLGKMILTTVLFTH